MRRVLLVVAVAVIVVWLHRRGAFDGVPVATVVAAAAGLAVVGGVLGAVIGAGHARERRAWLDYQDHRAQVPVARRAWFSALGESMRRMTLPALLAAVTVLVLWWKGRS
jgi:hypothetical protein